MIERRQKMMAAICPVCGTELLKARGNIIVNKTCDKCGRDIEIQISETGIVVSEEKQEELLAY